MASGPPVDFASGDHYAVLGVPRGASEVEIKRAYKTLARRHHPDKHPGGKEAAELSFKRIAAAYAVLRDPGRRKEYDVSGSNQSYVSYEEAERMWRTFCADRGDEGREGLPAAVPPDLEARRKATGLVLVLVMLVAAPRTMLRLLPAFVAAVLGAALVSRRRQAPRLAWCALALLLTACAAPWALRLRSGPPAPEGAAPPRGPPDGGALPLGIPHSGEEVPRGDGAFVRVADPRHRDSAEPRVEEGWERRLLGSLTAAIRRGQVLLVFSRQGCPWCERQLPVLRRALRRRGAAPPEQGEGEGGGGGAAGREPGAGGGAARPGAPAGRAALLRPGAGRAAAGAGAPPRGAAPAAAAPALRVFALDAEEFPALARDFRVEAFPTALAWGRPGAAPLAAQGFLDDQDLEDLLRAAATAAPAPAPAPAAAPAPAPAPAVGSAPEGGGPEGGRRGPSS